MEGYAIQMLKKAAQELDAFTQYVEDVTELMRERYATTCLQFGDTPVLSIFLENICIDTRGMRGLSIDLRRNPEKLKEVCDHFGVLGLDKVSRTTGSDSLRPNDCSIARLAQTFLNKKQFEDFYFPYLKQIFDYAEKYDKIVYCFLEGLNEQYYDYLKEAPKGHFVYHFEKDDIFKAKQVFKNNTH